METTKYLYELLVRFGPEGLLGAHAIDCVRVVDDGGAVSETLLPARAIDKAEASKLLGAQNLKLIAQVDAADAKRGEAVAERDRALRREGDMKARAMAAETTLSKLLPRAEARAEARTKAAKQPNRASAKKAS